jgi:hypothetical protein
VHRPMASPDMTSRQDSPKSIPEVARELWEMTTAYAKQETIDPLRGLGRFLGWGVGGAVMFGIGVILLTLSGLRALQTETDSTFTGSLTWAPYLIVALSGLVLILLAVWRISKRKGPGL